MCRSNSTYLASVDEVAKAFHRSKDVIRAGLRQRVFPWGYGIEMDSGEWQYIINRRRFEEIEGIKLQEDEQ